MIYSPTAHILEISKNSKLFTNPRELWEKVETKYVAKDHHHWPWEGFYSSESKWCPDASKAGFWLNRIPFPSDIILIPSYEDTAVVIKREDLRFIVDETYHYEFYLANEDLNFLICYNHHDFLIGCGDAKKWIKDLSAFSNLKDDPVAYSEQKL